MDKRQYSFSELGASSSLCRALINEEPIVKPFINDYFSQENILRQTEIKKYSLAQRERLVSVLTLQNQEIELSAKLLQNIDKINEESTFTITTGHQLNMATGPLYTVYKILEIINWCEKLNESQSKKHFVPVFWMATEDHDFEEINHINLFGSKIEWQHQSIENSVVGRIATEPTVDFIEQVLEKFRDETLKNKISDLLKAYIDNGTLASANRALINDLFGKFGLVIIDGDDKLLKEQFIPIAKSEIEKGVTFKQVSETNKRLEASDFHHQVFVRECNLFYVDPNGKRIRIEKNDNGTFSVEGQTFSEEELVELLENYPERFSPNALLRPIYQEVILPNIVYVGGGGEIAYWLQLKSTFNVLNIAFPLLKVRDSVFLIDQKMEAQMDEFGYSALDLKSDFPKLLKEYVIKNQTVVLSLEAQKEKLSAIKTEVLDKALVIDKNAAGFVEAEFQKMNNQLEKMEKKFIASEKKNQEKSVKQLERIRTRLYPNDGFQERYENYLNYIRIPDLIENLKDNLKQKMAAEAAIHFILLPSG